MDKILKGANNLLNKPSPKRNYVGHTKMSNRKKNLLGMPPESQSSEDNIVNV